MSCETPLHRRILASLAALGVAALLAAALPAPAEGQTPTPRRILFILLDDVGIENFGFYDLGDEPANTLALDPWVPKLLQFYDAWSNPLCSPTRATIQSGQYGFRTGVGKVIPSDLVWGLDTGLTHLLPKLLKAPDPPGTDPPSWEPYETAAFGKWHMGTGDGECVALCGPGGCPSDCAPDQGGDGAPIAAGYDWFDGILLDRQEDAPEPYDVPYFRYWRTYGSDAEAMTTQERGPDDDIYLTQDVVDAFIDWCEPLQCDDPEESPPWFAWVAFPTAHGPFHCPPQGEGEIYPAGTFDCEPSEFGTRLSFRNMITAAAIEIDRLLRHVAGTPEAIDEDILIILASDNGSAGSVAGDPVPPEQAKCTLFQGGVRVPLLIGGGMVTAGDVGFEDDDEHPVGLVDLYTTILTAVGLEPPAGVDIDGVDLSDEYFGGGPYTPVRTHLYSELFAPNFDPASYPGNDDDEGPTLLAMTIRNDQYKLVYNATLQSQMLFDLHADTWDEVDLLADGIDPGAEADALADLQPALMALHDNENLLDRCEKTPIGDPCTAHYECCSRVCGLPSTGPPYVCMNPSNLCSE